MNALRQRDLEIRLERVPKHVAPQAALEQYRTPPKIAADLLYRALARGDIAGCRVVDLGCGTGMFAIGSALLGAASVTGIDLDPKAVTEAAQAAADVGVEVEFRTANAETIQGEWDTCVTNPPFGAQFAGRKADTRFLEAAQRVAAVTYALHPENSREHLHRLSTRLGWDVERLAKYDFPIPHQFRFHTREKVLVPVVLYRITKAVLG